STQRCKVRVEVTGTEHKRLTHRAVPADAESARNDFAVRECECSVCGSTAGLLMLDEPRPVCVACAEVEQLAFLASVNALT
ncbi:MAG TPA: hypothetical protein VG295_00005, partial [Solirubrobacteraceae bacterium]|nr:hypothetical protein [Solirubrobacteraceae bacterium]